MPTDLPETTRPQGAERVCGQVQHICWQKPSGELQCAVYTLACDGMFLWCVQEVAELKEEDIISHRATDTKLPTATDTQLPTATDTQLPTATDTQLPTATDTQLPTATDTQLPTATDTQLPTAAAGVSGDVSRTLCKLQ